jgi:hypothetical protein
MQKRQLIIISPLPIKYILTVLFVTTLFVKLIKHVTTWAGLLIMEIWQKTVISPTALKR